MDYEYDYDHDQQYYDVEQIDEEQFLLQGADYGVNDEGQIQGSLKQQQEAHPMMYSNKKVVHPQNFPDAAFDFLLNEGNWTQIEEALIQGNPNTYYIRLGKVFGYAMNIFAFTQGQDDLMSEYVVHLEHALQTFLEFANIGEHTTLRVEFDPTMQICLKIDKNILGILVTMLLRSPSSLNARQAQLRAYLPRLLTFIACPPEAFCCTMQARETQAFVLQRMETEFLSGESQYFESQQLDIIGYVFYCDPNRHTITIKNIVQMLTAFLESFLECEDQAQRSQVQVSILNIIQLFVVLTFNEQLNSDFNQSGLHRSLYKAIKFSTPIFSQNTRSKVWANEPLIRKSMITFITRVLAYPYVDETLAQILLDDVLFIIQKQKFYFIHEVIFPILNAENVQYQPLCLHTTVIKETLKSYLTRMREFFKQSSQTQNLALSLRLQTDLLSFDQREQFGKVFTEHFQLDDIQEKIKKSKKKQKTKPIKQSEEFDLDLMVMFGDEPHNLEPQKQSFPKQSDPEPQPQQFQQLQPSEGQKPQLLQQQQSQDSPRKMEIEEPRYEVSGRWNRIHQFSPQNPVFTYQQVSEGIVGKQNLLFIFDLMCNFQNCRLVVFVENTCGNVKGMIGVNQKAPNFLQGQNNKNCNSSLRSFFSLFVDGKSQYTVQAQKKGTPTYVMLDLQQAGLNIVHRSEVVAYINFGNLNMSKFGFPFKELTEKSFETDQVQASMSTEENFLLGAEIWNFDPQTSTNLEAADLLMDLQLEQFSENKSIANLVSQYTSQFRLDPVHFVASSVTVGQLKQCILKQLQIDEVGIFAQYVNQQLLPPLTTLTEIRNLQQRTIIDLYIDTQKLNSMQLHLSKINHHVPRLLLNHFQHKIDGMVKIAHMLRKEVQRKQQQPLVEFFNDMIDLVGLQGYTEELLQQEQFLDLMIGIVFSAQQAQFFHKGIALLYKALLNLFRSSSISKANIIFSDHYDQMIQRMKQYVGSLYQDVQLKDLQQPQQSNSDANLKELFAGSSGGASGAKGKPKGIGYGDINYNHNKFKQQDSQPVQKAKSIPQFDELFGKEAAKFKQEIVSSILNSLVCVLRETIITHDTRKRLTQSKLFQVLKTLFARQHISDITQQEDLYFSALGVLRELASREELLDLFVEIGNHDAMGQVNELYRVQLESNSLYRMLESLKEQAVIYKQTFKETQVEDENGKKVSLLQTFTDTIEFLEMRLMAAEFITVSYEQPKAMIEEEKKDQLAQPDTLNIHQFYTVLMKPLAVGKCPNLQQDKAWLAKMESYAKTSTQPSAAKMNRLIQELTDLGNALPIEATNSIFVRYDLERMDVMRAIIFGASGTPYAHGAFQYELCFMDDYPNRPPKVLLSTTGHGKFRFNPNLYACGKVCLSLLGTWGDNWIANVSTILQILVSIMSMVMSEYVMFNEPGWEGQMGTPDGQQKNQGYCNLVRLSNIRYAMIEQLQSPPLGFEDVVKKSFYLRKDIICKEIEEWIATADKPVNYSQTQNQCPYQANPAQYKLDLIQAYNELKVELEKLKLSIGKDFHLQQDEGIKRVVRLNSSKENIINMKEKTLDRHKVLVLPFPKAEHYEIDTSYAGAVQQKAFDPTDANVQNLMSRYIGVLGVDAVSKQSEANVLLLGLGGLGVEIAKNITLSGVKRVTLWDDRIVEESDQCGQFYCWQDDLGNSRSKATLNKLRHLNPYVLIDYLEGPLMLQVQACIAQYSVVVIADDCLTYADVVQVARLCRTNNVGIVLAQSHGVYGRVATDFGEEFLITDADGEAPSEMTVESIQPDGLVVLFKNQKHNLQDGDTVLFQEIVESQGGDLRSLNQTPFVVRNVKRYSFEIGDITQGFQRYLHNGVAYQQKRKATIQFHPLEQVITGEIEGSPYAENMGLLFEEVQLVKREVLNLLFSYKLRYPGTIEAWKLDDADKFFTFTSQQGIREHLRQKFQEDVLIKHQAVLIPQIALFSLINGSRLPALDAYLGGLVCQEILKAITKKYTPIKQVYIHSCEEMLPFTLSQINQLIYLDTQNNILQHSDELFQKFLLQHGLKAITDPRYRPLGWILGRQLMERIRSSRLFMIGAGAIGCELLKNFAMGGFASFGEGCIYVTDPDVIENSNLNRQFLFREKHIRKPKAATAAAVAKQMNPAINVVARLDRVGPETAEVFHQQFFAKLDCVANALDNVQARLYVDGRCIESDTALIESGTLGPKGHVQVILPALTETYGSKRDPEEENDIPYCTLKMFPESALHCLEWARDKFEQYFVRKPQSIAQVLIALDQPAQKQALAGIQQQTLELALRCLNKLPVNFDQCIAQARVKYERLFNFAIIQLLTAYPLDSKDGSGKPFWSAPKRTPKSLIYAQENDWAVKFVHDYAILLAQCYGVQVQQSIQCSQIPKQDVLPYVQSVVRQVQVPAFSVSSQKMAQMKKEVEKVPGQMEEEQPVQSQQKSLDDVINEIIKNPSLRALKAAPKPQQFEKDDDTNFHVSFIASATNARARNYSIAEVDWFWCKLKAGRIVPAMATTTACISALQTIEIIKVLQQRPIEDYKNAFMNLAIPCIMQSEPGPCDKIKLSQAHEISIWTKHNYKITQLTLPLVHFVAELEATFGLPINSLKQGAKALYLSQMLPQDHAQKEQMLATPLLKLLDWKPNTDYMDLDVTFKGDPKEIQGPKIRLTYQ